MRRSITILIASAANVFIGTVVQAAPIVQESFYTGTPTVPAAGEYNAGLIAGGGVYQNPDTLGSVGSAWQGNTGTIQVQSTGLSVPGIHSQNGGLRFQHSVSLPDDRAIKRLVRNDYDLDNSTYYMSGLMSFDSNFGVGVTGPDNSVSTAYSSFTNTEDTNDNRSTTPDPGSGTGLILGVQWGFQGNGSGGVNAMLRLRNTSGDIENVVLQPDVTPDDYHFVVKVEPNVVNSQDRVTAWLNPADVASEAAAGTPTLAPQNFSVWVPGGADPTRIVEALTYKAWDVGANAKIRFDEFRFGTTWDDITKFSEQHLRFREGENGYEHVGSEVREFNLSFGAGDNDVILTGQGSGTTVGKLRTVLGWDLSDIPDDAVITNATLTMTPASMDLRGDGLKDIELYRIEHSTSTMVENEVDWEEIRDGVDWDSPEDGGDLGLLLGSIPGFDNSNMGRKTFVSTPELLQAVKEAVAQDIPLEMILVSLQTEQQSARDFVRWHSDDAGSLTNRPLLTVSFAAVPEPSGLALAIAALGWFVVPRGSRRRRFMLADGLARP